jgi:hypothetical protein
MKIFSYAKGVICAFLLLISHSVLSDWVDISSNIEITKSRPAFDRVNRVYFVHLDIKNTDDSALNGPFRILVDNSTIPVTRQSGNTETGVPFVDITNESITANGVVRVRVDFLAQRKALSFDAQVVKKLPVNPEVISHQFVELKGRDGHQGLFPILTKPQAGAAKLEIETNNDVKKLSVNITANGIKTVFVTNEVAANKSGTTMWLADISLASNVNVISFDMLSEYGDIITTNPETITTRTFKVDIAAESLNFTSGENFVALSITNAKATNASFNLNMTGSKPYAGTSLFTKTLNVEAKDKYSVLIPVTVPNDTSIHTLTISVQVINVEENTSEVATIEILVMNEPLTLSSRDDSVLINHSNCEKPKVSDKDIDIAIIGSARLDVNNIDLNTIELAGYPITPYSVDIADIGNDANNPCLEQDLDGILDLNASFDLQEIIMATRQNPPSRIDASISYFSKSGMRFSHRATLVFP